jgi:chromosome segregation ATPase
MDDVREALSSVRRDQRRIEDEMAQINRKKASNDDLEVIANKQSSMESEGRDRYQSLASSLHALNENVKRLADAYETLSEDHTRHKRKVASEFEAINEPITKENPAKDKDKGGDSKPFLPMQLQITLYVLAGVGLMALIQNAPAAMRTLPHIPAFGGG